MYLEKAIFINRAPFERIELDFIDKGVNVLSAINGKGKTTILSHIVDAFYEMAKKSFSGSFEGRENKYYRVSTSTYNLNQQKCSIVYLRFKADEEYYDYIDVRDNCSEEEYDQLITIEYKIPYKAFKSAIESNNNVKQSSKNLTHKKSTDIFNNNILTYFPSYRYEQPGYLNDPYKIKLQFVKESGYAGKLNNPIEVITGFSEFSNWLMDVILDNQLYGRTNGEFRILNDNIRRIVSQTLISKLKEPIRLGIGPRHRGGERISIMSNELDPKKHRQIYPSIFNLSTGELAMMSTFGEILRQSDKLRKQLGIEGIVLIDEVDKHLHIKLQKEILPQLMAMFPNLQFITSSHSPFFSMGLAEQMPQQSQIIDLDNNGIVCTPQRNELYKEVYNMMIDENSRYARKYEQLSTQITTNSRTIVITEGKTDIKHILKAKGQLNATDVDFDCIEVDCQPSGDSDLKKMLEQLSKIKRSNKVIGIFDRDIDTTVKDIEKSGQQYKSYGNNVYAFCIQSPQSRLSHGQTKISIEYLYNDDEIKTKLANDCRLFFGTEFKASTGRHLTENDLTLRNQAGRGEDKIVENNGGQAVYDNADNNHLAKKEDFADAILLGNIEISEDSWRNFTHIFDTIRTIIGN